MSRPLLEVSGLHKAFAAPVLKNLDFDLRDGEVHALMGSNGAGKSTLCNIVCGIHKPDRGALRFAGEPYSPKSLKDAEALGISMVMQELNLFPTLSVAENLLFRSMADRFGVVRHVSLNRRAAAALRAVGLDAIDPASPLREHGVGQQQLVEIASALNRSPKCLILDEPTAALTDPQIDKLFDQIRQLRDAGAGVLYISHRMDEIARIADRVSVLRDGELVATERADAVSVDRLVELMAGKAPGQSKPAGSGSPAEARAVAMKIDNLSRRTRNRSGVASGFENVSLEVRSGEVLGIGGLIGSGRTELLRAIFGADEADSGCIRLATDEFTIARRFRSPAEAMAHGIGMVVEDRKAQGLFLDASVRRNITFAKLRELTGTLRVVDRETERELAATMAKRLHIHCDSPTQRVATLSGGNQQKTLIARWLACDFGILLFDEPGRGVDINAKSRIHELIRALTHSGKAIVVVSSETPELLSLADRIAVMSNGRLAEVFDRPDVSEAALLEASFRYYASAEAMGA